MIIEEKDYLAHYGTPRHSGRYPWGSHNNEPGSESEAHPRNPSFLDHVAEMRKQGLSESDIAEGMGMKTTQLRARITIARNEQAQAQITQALRLQAKGMSGVAAAAQMGIPESTYRNLVKPDAQRKADILTSTSDMLKREVDGHNAPLQGSGSIAPVDVGRGVETYVNVSKEKLGAAVSLLEAQGYVVHNVNVPQRGTNKDTKVKVLTPPGTTWGEAQKNIGNIKQISAFSADGGETYTGKKTQPVVSIDPSRVAVKYGPDGGSNADGVIYVREGVEDVNLGKNRYAQVRIKVGDKHFIKGMAMYKDDMPPGVDLVFNTNKKSTGNKLDAFKELSTDPDFPFESVVRPLYVNPGAKDEHVVSAMNIVNEQGDWKNWSKNVSSQVLSKQSPILARTQLNITRDRRQREFDEISSLTNPAVKKKLLEKFAESTDSASVHLKAAALSQRQQWHAILPIENIKPGDVYAPNYRDGEKVVLIRYPHGGTFEIPELTVNNKHKEARRLLGDTEDAVGIHPSVAQHLSGADFDGDTVLVVPNNNKRIKHTPMLEGLKSFDHQSIYKLPDDAPKLTSSRKQQLMGDVSNLITDMTIKGAPHSELVRAVKHSMVVIDAEKHHLNYKQSAIDFNIKQLKAKYQGGPNAGASTIISKKKSYVYLPDRKPRPHAQGGPVDRSTGRLEFVPSGKTRLTKNGERVLVKKKYNRLSDATDARSLSSGTRMENIYADHSNELKAMANKARLSALNTPSLKYSPSAKKVYAKEVASLDHKLRLAKMNAPRERQAQVIANAAVKAKLAANPNLDKDSLKKLGFQEQEIARARLGSRRRQIVIEPNEWDAIQAGAIHNSRLKDILDNTELDAVKKLATPRKHQLMTPTNVARAKAMLRNGATRAEVAQALGVSVSTLDRSTA